MKATESQCFCEKSFCFLQTIRGSVYLNIPFFMKEKIKYQENFQAQNKKPLTSSVNLYEHP